MFAYGVTVARVVRGSVADALIIGVLGTAVGIAAGRGVLYSIVNENMPETMPDIGTLIAVAPSHLRARHRRRDARRRRPAADPAQTTSHRHLRDAPCG